MKSHIFLIANPKFQLQILCSFGDITKSVKFNGLPENNFHNSLIPRGAHFLLLLESEQEATSGWNFTKCISEVKDNQLKVKNMHVRMGISTFNWEHVEFDEGKSQSLPFLVVYHILSEMGTWPFLQLLLCMNSSEMQYKLGILDKYRSIQNERNE